MAESNQQVDPREKMVEEVNHLKEDIRAEVLVANWLQTGQQARVVIQPKGLFARDFDRDIMQAYVKGKGQELWLELNREGLYDALPEGFFHQPAIGQNRARERAEEMVSHSRAQRKEELHARRFFQPIEQAFFQQRVGLELSEREALEGFVSPTLLEEFARFWGLPEETPLDQLARICYVLPLAHKIVCNLEETTKVFEIVLQEKVNCFYSEEQENAEIAVHEALPGLGGVNLGLDFILGEKSPEIFPTTVIRVGPIPDGRIVSFLPGKPQRKVLDILTEYFFPAGYSFTLQIIPEKPLETHKQEEREIYLGYNSLI
ncbi:MAG: hypothetical protein AAFR61_02955 [Bacteroidota bacterium]